MMDYRIDLNGVMTKEELHERTAQALQLPGWFGGNLDALYDALTSVEADITIVGFDWIEKTLAEYARGYRMVFEDAVRENLSLMVRFEEEDEETYSNETGYDEEIAYDEEKAFEDFLRPSDM